MASLSDIFRDKLFQTIDSLRENLVKDTAEILKFETVSGGKSDAEKAKFQTEIERCLAFLKNLAKKNDLVYRDLDGIVSVIEQPAETNEKGLGIPLHIDVVPVTGEWKYPPFSGTIAEDTIWGRGTQDDKGPLVACLYAIIALKKLGVKFLRPIHIVMGRGEEVGEWSDVQHFLKKQSPPAFSFTPDAAFPIINGEKGIMNLRINANWETPEAPEEPGFYSLNGGTRANVVPDLAELRFTANNEEAAINSLKKDLEEFVRKNPGVSYSPPEACKDCPDCVKVVFHGKSAHGSLPQEGHNAILDALHFLSENQSASETCRKFCSFLFHACSEFFGEGLDIFQDHPFVGKTTVNLGICRIDEKGGYCLINIRPTLGFSCREVAERSGRVVRDHAAKNGIPMSIQQEESWGKEPLFVDPKDNEFFISSLQTAYAMVTGREPELKAIGGTTFAKAYPNCVSYGPVDPADEKEMAHMTDEHVKIEHQVRNTKIYAYALALLTTDAK
ncbi:Sapep family Mn(2+)-dependent dipeptidase [Candidatus Sumerlaeota bacterium]|nr:Sapep family Mn(2+)-dependent dipeptidase [Candidatus Sumerlaeota bacterium]